MEHAIRARLRWVELFEQTRNAGLTCRRCGISRPTLRKWVRRYERDGIEGLSSRSRRPLFSPKRRVLPEQEAWILRLRKQRRLGARRIQGELLRLHGFPLALATIHKVLTSHQVKPLVRWKRASHTKRYSRPIPGDRVQMDTMKVSAGLYQFTAIDDCTRYRVLAIFKRRTASNTMHFLEQVVEEMPFPIQRIQTDRGREFFAYAVQGRLREWGIKFRPVKPASPHLNGKVERSQKTDLDEFYPTVDLKDPDLDLRLAEWQHHYNWLRPHGSLGGKTPMDLFFALSKETPLWEEVTPLYDPSKERIRDPDYRVDLELARLKRSL